MLIQLLSSILVNSGSLLRTSVNILPLFTSISENISIYCMLLGVDSPILGEEITEGQGKVC